MKSIHRVYDSSGALVSETETIDVAQEEQAALELIEAIARIEAAASLGATQSLVDQVKTTLSTVLTQLHADVTSAAAEPASE